MFLKQFIFACLLYVAASKKTQNDGCVVKRSDNSTIDIFARKYYKKLSSIYPVDKAFNTSIPASEAAAIYYPIILNISESLVPDAQAHNLTNEFVSAVNNTFGSLTPCSYSEVHSLSAGQILVENHVLAQNNATKLAKQLARNVVKTLKSGGYSSTIEALSNDFVKYLTSFGLFTSANYPHIIDVLSSNFYYVCNASGGHCTS